MAAAAADDDDGVIIDEDVMMIKKPLAVAAAAAEPADVDAMTDEDFMMDINIQLVCKKGDKCIDGCQARDDILAALTAGKTLPVKLQTMLMHGAVLNCSAAFVHRLITECAFPASMLMHAAAETEIQQLEKFQLLPVHDLAFRDANNKTPLDVYLGELWIRLHNYGNKPWPDPVLEWMIQQPQCPVDTVRIHLNKKMAVKHWDLVQELLRGAIAARKRWTPARAAWLGAVAA